MKPAGTPSVTIRYKLKEFGLTRLGTVPAGRVMFCQNRKVLGYGDVANLARIFDIPRGTTEICLSAADYDDVKGWIG